METVEVVDGDDDIEFDNNNHQYHSEDDDQQGAIVDINDDNEEKKPPLLQVLGAPYARKQSFWSGIIISGAIQGTVLGLVALGTFVAFAAIQNATWNNDAYNVALDVSTINNTTSYENTLNVGSGQWYYVGLLAAGGAAIGLVKALWTVFVEPFPAKPAGFLDDIQQLSSDEPWVAIPIVICAILSIGCGASVGPEQPLGAAAVAIGGSALPFLSRKIVASNEKLFKFFDLRGQEKLCALDALAGAFGPLLPAQYLSPLLLHEVGRSTWNDGKFELMETITRTGIAASFGYAIFVGLKDETILEALPAPEAGYDVIQTTNIVNLLQGAVLGCICGIIGLLGVIMMGLCGKIGEIVNISIDKLGIGIFVEEESETSENEKAAAKTQRTYLGLILTPTVGGTLVGLLAVGCPLTLGDGSAQLGVILVNPKTLGVDTLIASAFVKLLALSISLGFGFVGGQVFPFLFAGGCIGSAAHLLVPRVPLLISYAACMTALPCAFLPLIFTFTTLSSMALALGGVVTSAVFCAAICSYTVVCGVGIIQRMIEKAAAKQEGK